MKGDGRNQANTDANKRYKGKNKKSQEAARTDDAQEDT